MPVANLDTIEEVKEYMLRTIEAFIEKAKNSNITSVALCFLDEHNMGHAEILIGADQYEAMGSQLSTMTELVINTVKKEATNNANTFDIGTSKTLN